MNKETMRNVRVRCFNLMKVQFELTDVKPEYRFNVDIFCTELSLAELQTALGKAFGVTLPELDIQTNIRTADDVVRTVFDALTAQETLKGIPASTARNAA